MGEIAHKGFRPMPWGADEKENHLIKGAYVKQAKPTDSEKTMVHEIAKHHPNSKMYSDKGKKK